MGEDGDEGRRIPIKVKVFGRTDVGLVREHNEDNFLVADLETGNRSLLPEVREHFVGARGTLLAVCDGMGGAAAGEIASQIAADTVYELMQGEPPENTEALANRLESAVLDAGKKIFESAKADRSRRGMGTTITAAALIAERIVFAQVGDSRAYLVREGKMVQVTRDQSLVNQLIEAGQLKPEEAELFEHSNIILQALGTAEDVTVDLTFADLRVGDVIVMCSDGLSGLVNDEQICKIVTAGPEPIDACKALTEAAREAGGHDNITVIVARFEGDALKAAGDDEVVHFQRLEIPGKKSFPQRQQAATNRAGWSASEDDEDEDESASAPKNEQPLVRSGRHPRGGTNPWWMGIAIVVVLVLGVILGYLIVSGTVNGGGDAAPRGDIPPEPPALPTVAGHFTADVPGTRLVIDGQDYGELPPEGRTIALEPGRHSVEGRFGPDLVDQQRLELRPDQDRVEIVFNISPLLPTPLDAGSPNDAGEGGVESPDADGPKPPDAAPEGPTGLVPIDEPDGAAQDRTTDAGARPSQPTQPPLTKLPPDRRQPPRQPPPASSNPVGINPYQTPTR